MGRTPRSHLPGAVFHLTARTQGHQPWFTESLRARMTEYLASAIRGSDSRLLAYAIMPNHLHLMVHQGELRLERIMQPLLCRTALLVQRRHGVVGHVFERRFRDHTCLDPRHVRNTIVYTHLNPVRAGLVNQAAAYPWSSHALYLDEPVERDPLRDVVAVERALGLFAAVDGAGPAELRRAYRRYVGWRVRRDRHHAREALDEAVGPPPPQPPVSGGDAWWWRTFVPPISVDGGRGDTLEGESPTTRMDLSDIAKRTLAQRAPTLPLERVRGNSKARRIVEIRRTMVCRMDAAGYAGCSIARYLRVSDQCVSNILVAARRAAAR